MMVLRGCGKMQQYVLNSARFINKGVETEGSLHVATGSNDRSPHLYKYDASGSMDYPKQVGAYKILRGHTSSVQSIAVDPARDILCSGSWDSTIKFVGS
ncbi:unnamed protein product [Urochloa humidicola]